MFYSTQSLSGAFLAVFATFFGTASWLRQPSTVPPQELRALYGQIVERDIKPCLRKTLQEYLGCQNVQYIPSSSIAPNDYLAKVDDVQLGIILDADAASENLKGSVIGSVVGFGLTAMGREEIELVILAQKHLKDWDSQGVLRREGRAVLLVSCKGSDGIWVYGEEGVEVKGAITRVEMEGGWMSQILILKKEYPFRLSLIDLDELNKF